MLFLIIVIDKDLPMYMANSRREHDGENERQINENDELLTLNDGADSNKKDGLPMPEFNWGDNSQPSNRDTKEQRLPENVGDRELSARKQLTDFGKRSGWMYWPEIKKLLVKNRQMRKNKNVKVNNKN